MSPSQLKLPDFGRFSVKEASHSGRGLSQIQVEITDLGSLDTKTRKPQVWFFSYAWKCGYIEVKGHSIGVFQV